MGCGLSRTHIRPGGSRGPRVMPVDCPRPAADRRAASRPGGRRRISPRRWGSHASASRRWIPRFAGRGRGRSASIGPPARTAARRAPPPRWRPGSSRCASSTAAGRTGSVPELGVAPRTVSRILRRHQHAAACASWTRSPVRSSASSKTTAVRYERPGPASWCTWTSRRSAASPTAAAGAPMAGPHGRAGPSRVTEDRLRLRPLPGR